MGLLMFYGTECKHCHEMMPLVEKLESETGKKVKQIETWHNSANKKKLEATEGYDDCGGVPFFFNEESKMSLCGSVPYGKLKAWAEGK
jgi:thiol-disulfide isomerase/thioredoxin